MTDLVLDRITATLPESELAVIPWPEGLAPGNHHEPAPSQLPEADVLLMPWTYAEAQSNARVLTPGYPLDDWAKYTDGWPSYEKELTGRSPARESKCLGVWAVTQIGEKTVVVFKPDLHLSTDSTSLPVARLVKQLVAAVKPKLVITTGTAGGIGAGTVLGDVCVTNSAKFDCQQAFKNEPYAQQTFVSADWTPGAHLAEAQAKLIPVNAGKLRAGGATRNPVIHTLVGEPGITTVDFFGFADTEDSYGIKANNPHALNEDMDDAAIFMALDGVVPVLSVRNSSDPEVPQMASLKAEKAWAEQIYERYGGDTTVGSAIACWAVISDLAPSPSDAGRLQGTV